jgi:hypothetical protein
VPLCFIVGDVEGQDVLCGHYHSHHTNHLQQECDCPTDQALNSKFECTFTSLMTSLGCEHPQTRKNVYNVHPTMILIKHSLTFGLMPAIPLASIVQLLWRSST